MSPCVHLQRCAELQRALDAQAAATRDKEAQLAAAYHQLRGVTSEQGESVQLAAQAASQLRVVSQRCGVLKRDNEALTDKVAELELAVDLSRAAAERATTDAASTTRDMEEMLALMDREQSAHTKKLADQRDALRAEQTRDRHAHDALVAQLKRQHSDDMAAARKAHSAELDRVMQEHTQALERVRQASRTGDAPVSEDAWRERFKELGSSWAERLQSVEHSASEELDAVKAKYEDKLKEQHEQWEQRVDAAVADWSEFVSFHVLRLPHRFLTRVVGLACVPLAGVAARRDKEKDAYVIFFLSS